LEPTADIAIDEILEKKHEILKNRLGTRIVYIYAMLIKQTFEPTAGIAIDEILKSQKFSKIYLLLNTLNMYAMPLEQTYEPTKDIAISEILKSRYSEKSTCYPIHCIASIAF